MTSAAAVSETTWQVCEQCRAQLDERDPRTQCPNCGGLLEVTHSIPFSAAQLLQRFKDRRQSLGAADASGVWRYRELVLDASDVVTFPEGNTPLIASDRVATYAGCPGLLLKHEGLNPTGSFKDRGMTVGMTQARRVGAPAVACASTGNTSASLAAYAARAGLPALVFVPAGHVALGKLAQTLGYGARTLLVRGDFDACLTLVREAVEKLGVYLLNSINPFRVEGQKTIVFELLEQCAWDAPDWIAFPAGNLGNAAAFGKALREAHGLGLIARMPRLLAVQATGAAPFYRSFRNDFRVRETVTAETIATAIRIGDPASYNRAVAAIRLTNGVVSVASDDEILDAKAAIDAAGVGCEPASAASVAGVRGAVRDGTIKTGERVVAILTGHILKDPGILTWYHQESPIATLKNTPIEVDADVRAVEAVLRSATT